MISPGHGFYYHHGYKDWRAQRESVNGILEDDITMPMASKLQWALELGGANARLTRANALGAHQASGLLWSKLSSRYTLEALLPENPEIWHSMPKSTKPLRDRDEDLRSRPLYANFLKADALIHVHTNADGNPKATGARAIIHPGRENQALAKNILCSMRELIHANESFSDYVVPSDPSVMTNKGENRLAKMPSVIVEVGFHTNPSDAAYLKDVTFQQLAMRGVAKGFRLFRDGKHCEQFAVSDVKQEKPGPWGDLMFSATLMGNPAFPIYIRHGKKGCADRRCRDESPALYSREDVEKYRLMYLCKREDHGAIDFEASAIDFDKVESEHAFFQVTCGQSRR